MTSKSDIRSEYPEDYARLLKLEVDLKKFTPKLDVNCWICQLEYSDEFILVVTFISQDKSNPVQECLISDTWESPEGCLDDLSYEQITRIMDQPLRTGSWL